MDEIVFSSLIAFEEKLTSQCDNLSTHHDHTTYYPFFDTQFRHSPRLRNNIFALLPYLSGKAKVIEPPFCTKEICKEKTRKLLWQRLDWQEKGILAKVVKNTQRQLNPTVVVVPGDFVAIILWLPSLPYAFGAASNSSSYLSRLPSSLSPFLFV